MSWATKRQALIIGGIILVLVAIVLAFTLPQVIKAPSCMNGKQDGKEEGVDCGGTCTYLCRVSQKAPTVVFARPFSPASGRTDVIASIANPNARAAARAVGFSVELYDTNNRLIATKDGTFDLPANATVPVYIPNFFSGNATVVRAFLQVDDESLQWFAGEYKKSPLSAGTPRITQGASPRVETTIDNTTAQLFTNVKVIATVYDTKGNAIGASQTVLPQVPPQGSADAVFTWNVPFSADVGPVDIQPILPLARP